MKVLVLLSILAMVLAKRKRCGENECYTTCGTACPLTCENYLGPPTYCTDECVVGCRCKKGFIRSYDGLCVKPEDCPEEKCGENEHYNGCGTSCPLTCENYHNPPKYCILTCKMGCECHDGFVLSHDGRCIKPEDCEVCGENERYSNCATACPITCDNFANPPKDCTMQCLSGCECKEGFVRNADKLCVLPSRCPLYDPVPYPQNCYQLPDSGDCLGYFIRFYYNVQERRCKEFIYHGCKGNGNRYETEEECIDHCGGYHTGVCALPKDAGSCHNDTTRFYFEQKTFTCKQFTYNGCLGNKNNFITYDECVKTCIVPPQIVCQQEKKVGRCLAIIHRFYYNKRTRRCEPFIYGGCEGNLNNFKTLKECEDVCCSG